MDFDQYQKQSRKTAVYPKRGKNYIYPTLGLVGEAGEVAEKIKKIIRDDAGVVSKEAKDELKKELGDVLWYLSNISSELKISLSSVAELNLEKLSSRKRRGKLHGSGDNR